MRTAVLAVVAALGAPASADAAVQAVTWDTAGHPLNVPGQAPGFSRQFVGRAAQVVASPTRRGGHAIEFTLRKGAESFSGPRSELSDDDVLGGERWYGFSTYLSHGWSPDRAGDIVAQWHGVGPKGSHGSPSLSIGTQAGQWQISRNPDNHYLDQKFGPVARGRWTDWVVHVRWADDRSGFVQVWRDGRKLLDVSRLQTGYSKHPQTYFKYGIYKWPWGEGERSDVTQRVVVEDELRIAGADGSYHAVAPG